MRKLLVFIMFLWWMNNPAQAMGLQTYFAKVLIENLNIGGTYSTQKLANLPLAIKNTSEYEVNLKIETVIPTEKELAEGYEVIPDKSWVRVEKDTFFNIRPQEMAVTDVIITIPDDKNYLGKKFQTYIWSHTFAKEGIGVGVGLKSKLFFTINEEVPLKEEKEIEGIGSFDFKVVPEAIYVEDVSLGTLTYCGSFTITNLGTQTLSYEIKSIDVGTSTLIPDKDYESCPNLAFLEIKDEKFVLASGQKKEVDVFIKFNDEKEYKGKKYMFLLDVKQENVGYYIKIFVNTRGE